MQELHKTIVRWFGGSVIAFVLMMGSYCHHEAYLINQAMIAGVNPIEVKIAYGAIFNEGDLASMAILRLTNEPENK